MEYYKLTMKSVGAAILFVSSAPQIANLQITSLSLETVLTIAKYARWPLLLIVVLHLALVVFSYKWIYAGLEKFFGFILGKVRLGDMLSDGVKTAIHSKFAAWTPKVVEEYKKIPFPVDVIALGMAAYAGSYFDIIQSCWAASIAVLILFPLSEYKRFWCKDDTEGDTFSWFDDHKITVVVFTEEEGRHRRMTRIITLCLMPIFLSLSFITANYSHNWMSGMFIVAMAATPAILWFRNMPIFASAKADRRAG
jgi:hypothetical protein